MIKNQHSWNPSEDTIWVFHTYYIDRIDQSAFISSFCSNKYFKNLSNWNDGISICPIALYDDYNSLKPVTQKALKSLKKLYKDEEWWDDKYNTTSTFDKNLYKVAKTTYNGKRDLRGSVIFRVVRGELETISEIKHFLIGLKYCAGHYMLNMTHFNTEGEQVTVFEYDCESG